MVSTMELLTIFIIGFAIFACLFFVWVLVWGFRGLSEKEDDNPVHIQESSWQPIESRYGSPYPSKQQAYSPYPVYHQEAAVWNPYENYTDAYYQSYQQYPYVNVAWDDSPTYEEEYKVTPPRIVPKMPKEYNKTVSAASDPQVDYAAEPPAKPSAPIESYPGQFATEGMHDIVKLVTNYNAVSAAGYPAFASSEPKVLGPGSLAGQQFYNVKDYAYTADEIMPPPSVDRPDYVEGEIKEDLPMLQAVTPESQAPRIEKRIRSYKQTLNESTKCNVCLGFIKTGLPLITCVCFKSYHVSCAYRMEQCPICGQDLLSYDDLLADDFPEEITLKPVDDTTSPMSPQPVPVDNQSDIDKPIHQTMASLTAQQKEKLKNLLSKYETNRSYKPLATSDILSD
jgi:hypothetical protein